MRTTAVAAAAALALGGCSGLPVPRSQGAARLVASSAIPAVEGTARFGRTDDDNTSIELRASHLARPERLTPPAATYVVWLRPAKNERAQNVGALAVDDRLNGALSAITPFKAFELFITAEPAADVREPSGEPLLWTTYQR